MDCVFLLKILSRTGTAPSKIALFLFITLSLFSKTTQAQVFWTENFSDENIATSYWVSDGVNNGPARWTWTPDPNDGYLEPTLPAFGVASATDGYFFFNSDNNGLTPHDARLTGLGNPADCSGKTGVRLRFFTQYIYFNPQGTQAQVGVSTNGVDFTYHKLFNGLPANLPYHNWVEVDLDEADGQPQVWLRFRWTGNYEYHWKIDSLELFTPGVSNVDSCDTPVDINAYFGQEPGMPQTTALFDNSTATASPADPAVSCWNEAGAGEPDILNTTMWFTFSGDGGSYAIQTVPCNATNYIGAAQGSDGDTQMLVFAGDNCADLTPVACNDDLFADGLPDWRAGLTLETAPGQRYFLLVDAAEMQGIVATGEFCIEITQLPAVPCAQGQAGSFNLEQAGYLCRGENLADVLNIDSSSFTLPDAGPQSGLAWCFSAAPIPANTWPGAVPGIQSTPFSPGLSPPFLLNNGTTLNHGQYYLTPVVLGGGILIDPGTLPFVSNIDPAGGCYFVGASIPLTLLPDLNPPAAAGQPTNATLPPGNNGAIALSVSGGAGEFLNDAGLYVFYWSTGQTTKDIGGLSAGAYTVTISDPSGCSGPIVLTITVDAVVGSKDPAVVQKLDIRPNPTGGLLHIELDLAGPAALRLDVLTMQGQLVQSVDAGTAGALNHTLDLSPLAEGSYLLRLYIDGEIALRQILLQR